MAASKNKKVTKTVVPPTVSIVASGGSSWGVRAAENPDKFLNEKPSWRIANCDGDTSSPWPMTEERLRERIWDAIFPKLLSFERMTWAEILIGGKKQHHAINVADLNKVARDRLAELHIEAEAIYSLRLAGQLRLYGYMERSTFHIVWYDDDHGDNDTCVCRSHLKHT